MCHPWRVASSGLERQICRTASKAAKPLCFRTVLWVESRLGTNSQSIDFSGLLPSECPVWAARMTLLGVKTLTSNADSLNTANVVCSEGCGLVTGSVEGVALVMEWRP